MRNPNSCVRPSSRFVSNPGSRIHEILEPRFDGKGISLVKVGQEDIQQSIEAYAPYTDLNYMLSRLSVGDDSVLSRRAPLYGDFSGLPTNPIDAINLVHSAETSFGQLSAEDKALYNNDYRVWLSSIMSGRTVSSGNDVVSVDNKMDSVKEVSVNEP